MGGSVVKVEIVFLDVLAMVALAGSHAIGSLFQNRVFQVPEGHTKHQKLVAVADCCQSVFAPAVYLAASHVVGEEIPSRSVRAVVFTHRSPGTFTDEGTPAAPQKWLSLGF